MSRLREGCFPVPSTRIFDEPYEFCYTSAVSGVRRLIHPAKEPTLLPVNLDEGVGFISGRLGEVV